MFTVSTPMDEKLLISSVKDLRTRLGWSQMKLAIHLEMSLGAIQRFENHIAPKRVATLERLAELARNSGHDDLAAVFGFQNDPIPPEVHDFVEFLRVAPRRERREVLSIIEEVLETKRVETRRKKA